MSNIITHDEKWIFTHNPETKRQSMDWKTPTSPKMKKARMSKSKFSWALRENFLLNRFLVGKQVTNIIIKRC